MKSQRQKFGTGGHGDLPVAGDETTSVGIIQDLMCSVQARSACLSFLPGYPSSVGTCGARDGSPKPPGLEELRGSRQIHNRPTNNMHSHANMNNDCPRRCLCTYIQPTGANVRVGHAIDKTMHPVYSFMFVTDNRGQTDHLEYL